MPFFFRGFSGSSVTEGDYTSDPGSHSSFGFSTKGGGVRIRNASGGANMTFSFTGQEDHGFIASGSADLVFLGIRTTQIFVKSDSEFGGLEVYAWTEL